MLFWEIDLAIENIFDWVPLLTMQTHYVLLLCSFKEQLQQHVRVHAMEAVMACWEIEQSLQSLTGDVYLLQFPMSTPSEVLLQV